MKPLDRLSEYLGAIERRLRLIALTRGLAVTAGVALALTILAVLVINQLEFSGGSVTGARVFLFLRPCPRLFLLQVFDLVGVCRWRRPFGSRLGLAQADGREQNGVSGQDEQRERDEHHPAAF